MDIPSHWSSDPSPEIPPCYIRLSTTTNTENTKHNKYRNSQQQNRTMCLLTFQDLKQLTVASHKLDKSSKQHKCVQ